MKTFFLIESELVGQITIVALGILYAGALVTNVFLNLAW